MRVAGVAGVAPGDRLALASIHARALGVTRLADVTGLDRVGVPVWQAVRPMGRSLSVHQGKGLTVARARLSALMEAIECALAEAWDGPVRRARHGDLPAGERAVAADDVLTARGMEIAAPIDWTPIERVDRPGRLWVPAAAVSLDLTRPAPAGVEQGSNGQGAGFTRAAADLKALCELIERDAVAAWVRRSIVERTAALVDNATVRPAWFGALVARLERLGLALRVAAVPAVIAMPVFAAELIDPGTGARHVRSFGTAAHPVAERALAAAVTEAAQSRLTQIAGARDDIEPGRSGPAALGFTLAPPPGHARQPFAGARRVRPFRPARAFERAVAALADAGYPAVARATLSPPGSPIHVVKLFVPGLGAGDRRRRAPPS